MKLISLSEVSWKEEKFQFGLYLDYIISIKIFPHK